MTTDRRTSEPTEAQVEAAAKAMQGEAGGFFSVESWRAMARAALEAAARAAQSAAPQAECSERPGGRPCEASKPGHKLHWSNGPREERGNVKLIADARALSEYLSEHIPGSRYKPVIDRLANALEAAPVLPSSTVDEDALAEVLSQHVLGEPNGGTSSWAWINCSCGHRIEIAGVTREHVLALGRVHQARAVAEWLNASATRKEQVQ